MPVIVYYLVTNFFLIVLYFLMQKWGHREDRQGLLVSFWVSPIFLSILFLTRAFMEWSDASIIDQPVLQKDLIHGSIILVLILLAFIECISTIRQNLR